MAGRVKLSGKLVLIGAGKMGSAMLEGWLKAGVSGDPQKADACLKCHVTAHGVAAAQKDPTFTIDDGVGCEACHGPFRAGHPDEYMVIPVSPDRCGDCHTDHLIDWQAGDHGGPDQSCIDCHQVHSWSAPTL